MSARTMRRTEVISPESESVEPLARVPDQSKISALAYQFWLERGCPLGSAEVDWLRAEEELKGRMQESSSSSAFG